MATCAPVRQGGLGKGATLTLKTVLQILVRMEEPALLVQSNIMSHKGHH